MCECVCMCGVCVSACIVAIFVFLSSRSKTPKTGFLMTRLIYSCQKWNLPRGHFKTMGIQMQAAIAVPVFMPYHTQLTGTIDFGTQLTEPRYEKNRLFGYAITKTQISCAVTAQLISVFVFATQIVQPLYFLNPKFQASSHLLWQHSSVRV